MEIGTKIALGFGLAMALMVMVIIIGVTTTNGVVETYSVDIVKRMSIETEANKFMGALGSLQKLTLDFDATYDAKFADESEQL